jgi:hypothetical protein
MIARNDRGSDTLSPQQAVDLIVRLRSAVERQAAQPTDDADEQLDRAVRELLTQLLGREPSEGELLRASGI